MSGTRRLKVERIVNDVISTLNVVFISAAVVVSFSVNKSILWALVHGLFGAIYLILFSLDFVNTIPIN